MVNSQPPANQSATSSTQRDSTELLSNLQKKFDGFFQSLGDVLTDITALEVNTMVSKEITGEKFIPWEAYRDLYPINEEYLRQMGVDESLHPQYLKLRKSLELGYTLLITDPSSDFYEAEELRTIDTDAPIMTDSEVSLAEIESKLPNPHDSKNCQYLRSLLANSRFLSLLRKNSELKAALDARSETILSTQTPQFSQLSSPTFKTDVIYAQTVIQIDGDVMSRYSQEIFNHPQRDLILQIHKISVESGHQQWRGLFGFVISMVRDTLDRGLGSAIVSLPRNQSNGSN